MFPRLLLCLAGRHLKLYDMDIDSILVSVRELGAAGLRERAGGSEEDGSGRGAAKERSVFIFLVFFKKPLTAPRSFVIIIHDVIAATPRFL